MILGAASSHRGIGRLCGGRNVRFSDLSGYLFTARGRRILNCYLFSLSGTLAIRYIVPLGSMPLTSKVLEDALRINYREKIISTFCDSATPRGLFRALGFVGGGNRGDLSISGLFRDYYNYGWFTGEYGGRLAGCLGCCVVLSVPV